VIVFCDSNLATIIFGEISSDLPGKKVLHQISSYVLPYSPSIQGVTKKGRLGGNPALSDGSTYTHQGGLGSAFFLVYDHPSQFSVALKKILIRNRDLCSSQFWQLKGSRAWDWLQ
jgi:hypothetical protein